MADVEATALANQAVRLGLLSTDQVQEGWDELGARGGDPEPFLRAMERKGHLTPWQSQKLLKGDKDGFFLGGYRILYKIASGSFGRVYRADDPRSGRVVAVKVLRRKWSEDKHNIDMFEREGRMGMTLQHPNIVEILAVNRDVASRQYYIVMEFVEGGNLRDFLNIRKKLEPPEVLRILEEVCQGLVFALSRGVTHRDMKLTNILLSTLGTAKLVDFGLATLCGKAQTSDEFAVDRTVDYAGLEKATNVSTGDTRSDIYFLGCVAYELLTGRSPLEMTRNAKARMAKERFTGVPPISPEEVSGPPSLIRLVETMMSLNPHERFQTPSQVLEAVRDVRREVEGKSARGKAVGQRTLFLAERDERLQDLLREKFKENGFRVLIAGDPARAVDRFKQQPFDVLIVNAGTTGEDGLHIFQRIMDESEKFQIPCAGVLLLNEDQTAFAKRVKARPRQSVLVQPVKFKQLLRAIQDMLGIG